MSIPGIILLIAAALFIYLFNGLVIKRSRVENFYLYYKAFLKRRMEHLEDLLAMLPDEADPLQIKVKDLLGKHCLNSNIIEQSQWDCALTGAWKELFESIKDNVELKDILNRLERNGGYLATVRQEYNKAVSNLNNEIKVFPWSALAKKMKISPRTPLEIPQDEWYKPLKLSNFRD